jgi:hypothetical protein
MVHPASANVMGHHLARLSRFGSATPLGLDSYDDRAALRETIERKAKKNPEKSRRPVGLLIYIDGVFHPAGMPSVWARTILSSYGPQQRWTEIWLYDAARDLIVAQWSKHESAA